MTITLLPETEVVGAAGVDGTNAHKIDMLAEYTEVPNEFLAWITKLYVVPVVRPVAVKVVAVTPDCKTE